MDIIKRLQLNKNPKDIKSGSIIGAKNLMLDPISSSITTEYGFKDLDVSTENIKGIIPVNDGVCIFSSDEIGNGTVILYKDSNITETFEGIWKWEGGKEVIGAFAYNYKKELILAVSELTDDESLHIPLKIINFNKNQCLNLEAPIPFFTPSYTIEQEGLLACGVYTFFIRFKLDENTYSKWFQLTDDIIIIDALEKEEVVHYFDIGQPTSTGHANVNEFKNLYINNNLKSDKNIHLNVSFVYNEETNYNECQIGYVIRRDSDVLGRLLGDYKINYSESLQINFDDNKFIEEIEINDFLEEPNQFYNVKNLVNYNNRLYISNYSEYKKYSEEDLRSLVDSVIPEFKHIKVLDNNETYEYSLLIKDDGKKLKPYNSENEVTQLNHEETIEYFKSSLFWKRVVDELNDVENHLKMDYDIEPIYSEKKYYTLKDANWFIGNSAQNIFIYLAHFDINNFVTVGSQWQNDFYIERRGSDYYLVQPYGENQAREINLSNAKWGLMCYTNVYGNGVQYSRSSKNILSDHSGIRGGTNTFYTFTLTSSKVIKDFRKIGIYYNNNRTLIPGQLYNFYIHFVRKDLSATDGYKITYNKGEGSLYTTVKENWTNFPVKSVDGKLYYIAPFVEDIGDANKAVLTIPRFSVQQDRLIEKGFVGFFISYEKVETTILNIVPINQSEEDDINYIHYTNTELIYNLTTFNGKVLETLTSKYNYINPNRQNNPIKNKVNTTSIYNTKILKVVLENTMDFSSDINEKQEISYRHGLYNDTNVYKSKVKTLYQLTPITFVKGSNGKLYTNEDTAYMYLPGFLNNEKVITYDKNLILSATQTKVYNDKGETQDAYKIITYTYSTYSQIPLNAFSIKQDYEKGSIVINNNVYSNSVLSPSKLQDFLEIKPAYTSLPLKSFTNYQDSTIDEFNKTIYRSDIISDESLNNGFRHFSIENYKNIIENKGNIVNIIGVGLYLLVHTEYSLFVFDRNNQLSDKAQLQIPDVFDIDYKELTPSYEGFGGLKYKDESILTKNGYIWFDRVSKSIFMFTGQDIKPLSADIHRLLKNYFETENNYQIRFAEDYYSNRLIITIRDASSYITLSYSFDSNTFISAHDYTFDKNYKTYNNSYIFSEKHPTKLFVYDKKSVDYKDLDIGRRSILTKLVTTGTTQLNSYIDIIFTDKYELPKVLNSISYVMSRNNKYEPYTNVIDQYFNTNYEREPHQNKEKLYSGYQIAIATDLTFSGTLSLDKTAEVNSLNNYRRPHWNQGIWNFNWFRENLPKNVTEGELEQQNVNNQMKEVYEQHDDLYPLSGLEKSDMRSAIIGKYFILRFIFERKQEDLNLKFETVDVNISKL